MSSLPIPITHVRWPNKDAAGHLESFLDGNRFAGRRPPRGLDPEYVSFWLRENIKPDSGPGTFLRVVDVLRFYERPDVLAHISRMLTRTETEDRAFRRSCYILQAIGEVGTPEQTMFAARYFHEFILPQPLAMQLFELVLETAEALALAVDTTLIGHRLNAALDAASKAPNLEGSGGIPWRKYSDYNRNNLPRTVRTIEAKRRLFAADPTQRVQELILIYLGGSEFSSASMEIWAGRLLRKYAMDGGQAAVVTALKSIIDGALASQMTKPQKEFFVCRCAQAVLYLQGKLTFPQEEFYQQIKDGPQSFLWDDIN